MPRVKRYVQKGFTTVNNDFLRDTSLALAERGLLITMLSLPDGWNMSGRGLASILPDGRDKVFSTLTKLEIKGYLRREQIRENGQFVDTEYQFCDIPVFKEENEKKFKEKELLKQKRKQQEMRKKEELKVQLAQQFMFEAERKEAIKNKLFSLKENELKNLIEQELFEKKRLQKELGISDKFFDDLVDCFFQVFEKEITKRNELVNAGPLDVLVLLEKTENKKERKNIILHYFSEEGVFLR